jgi:hypothetical protein
MGESSFPTTREGLHTHFGVIIPRFISEKVRLGISAKIPGLQAKYGDDTTDNTYIKEYNNWANISTRTKPVTDRLTKLEKDLKRICVNIYKNIPADLWNDEDRAVFNRKTGLPTAQPVHHQTQIPEEVFFKIVALENGEFEFICRHVMDSSKPSLPERADAVEVIFDIRTYEKMEDQPAGTGNIKLLPSNIKECPYKEIFYKAKFKMKVAPENVGKYIVVYVRWINTRHPEVAGNYSGPQAADIR